MTEEISFPDWEKIDIRVGTILEIAPHPDADKLYILKIDEGKDTPRQLVAGLREAYTEDELKGKKIVFLANLEPKELRGELSQGMILAVEDGSGLHLLIPDAMTAPGSKIK